MNISFKNKVIRIEMIRTAIDKMIDLLFSHPGAFGSTQGAFLLLTPFIDKSQILSIASCS